MQWAELLAGHFNIALNRNAIRSCLGKVGDLVWAGKGRSCKVNGCLRQHEKFIAHTIAMPACRCILSAQEDGGYQPSEKIFSDFL